eukprot:1159025-Pelagomonas_calceolata.AAC.2
MDPVHARNPNMEVPNMGKGSLGPEHEEKPRKPQHGEIPSGEGNRRTDETKRRVLRTCLNGLSYHPVILAAPGHAEKLQRFCMGVAPNANASAHARKSQRHDLPIFPIIKQMVGLLLLLSLTPFMLAGAGSSVPMSEPFSLSRSGALCRTHDAIHMEVPPPAGPVGGSALDVLSSTVLCCPRETLQGQAL